MYVSCVVVLLGLKSLCNFQQSPTSTGLGRVHWSTLPESPWVFIIGGTLVYGFAEVRTKLKYSQVT